MKRFWRTVTVDTAGDGFTVALDGRALKTPGRAALAVPSRTLAEAIAAEWDGQDGEVRPHAMPMMRFASTALDRVAPRRAEVVTELARWAGTDLVCYRAAYPVDLAERQARFWQPLVDWLAERHGVALTVTEDLAPSRSPGAAIEAAAALLAARTPFELMAIHVATTASGSLAIALALWDRAVDVDAAVVAAQVDERWQMERWGEEADALVRLDRVAADLADARRFLDLLG
jgi:chaperone required for assembly of F1-ATPase